MLQSIASQSSVQRRMVGFAWFHASVKRLQRDDCEGAPLQLSALNDVRELKTRSLPFAPQNQTCLWLLKAYRHFERWCRFRGPSQSLNQET